MLLSIKKCTGQCPQQLSNPKWETPFWAAPDNPELQYPTSLPAVGNHMLWTEFCSFKSFYVETLIPNETVFGNRAIREVITIKCSHEVGTPTQFSPCACTQRKDHVRIQWQEDSHLQARNQSWWHLDLDFWDPDCEKINFCCLSHSACDILLQHS